MLILHNLFLVYLNKRSAQTQHPFLATLMGLIFVGINFADFEDWVLSAKIGPNENFERSYLRNFVPKDHFNMFNGISANNAYYQHG